MKKLIVILIASFVLSFPAIADDIDLSTMAMDELINLRSLVSAEIYSRLDSSGSEIYSGRYRIGLDIKPGLYVLTLQSSSGYPAIITYNGDDSYGEDAEFHRYDLGVGESFQLSLQEDMTLILEDVGQATLKSISKPDWMP